LFFLE
jgi:tetratricopeptide (TPR) repeat protein